MARTATAFNKEFVGMDLHKAMILAVPGAAGKLTMESTIETKAATILESFMESVEVCQYL